MKNFTRIFIFLLLLGFGLTARAVEMDELISASMASFATKLITTATSWLVIFVGLQFVVTNFGLLKSGTDIEAVFGKLLGSILWIGFCFYLLNNGPSYIDKVGNQFIGLLGVDLPDKGTIFDLTFVPGLSLLAGSVVVGGMGAVGSVVGGQILMAMAFAIMGMGAYLIIKLFMIKLELLIVVILSPLSFAFLGLNALKDQGIAPLKSLISLGYRIVLTTIILGAFSKLGPQIASIATSGLAKLVSVKNMAEMIIPFSNAYGVKNLLGDIMYGLFGYVVLVYLLFKSDSIAASLASGSTNMGAGDVASAAAAGAALGAAGVAASAPLAEKGKSMADVIKSMGADAGKITDVSTTGGGVVRNKI